MASAVVCGIRNEEDAERTLRTAADLAERLDLRLIVAHVASAAPLTPVTPVAGPDAPLAAPHYLPPEPSEGEDSEVEELRAAACEGIEAIVRKVGVAPASVRVELGGDPASGLRRVAEDERAQMLVVASRGHGALHTTLLGSTIQDLVREAPCPVLVVPPRREDEDRRA